MMIAACLTLSASWLLLATANAHPHHQLLYGPGFQTARQAPHPGGAYYYHPQTEAVNVASVHQYAAPPPVALPPQYVLLYPGGGPQNNFVYGRADVQPRSPEGETRPPTIWNLFNVFQRPTTTPKIEAAEGEDTTTVATPVDTPTGMTTVATLTTTAKALTSTVATTVEETTPKSSDEASAKPEKISTDEEMMVAEEQKASLENFDENLPQAPEVAGSPSSEGRQFTLVQRPQFFGNYDFLGRNNMHQRFGIPPGAVSNFLLFRNGFAPPGAIPSPVQPGRPLKLEQENVIPSLGLPQKVDDSQEKGEAIVPGSAALAFQQDFKAAQEQAQQGAGVRILGSAPQPLFFAPQVFPPFPRHVASPGIVNVGPGYQNLFLVSPGQAEQSVVVDADRPRKEDVDGMEAEQAGPSVAQAKPQAIALAGVGGVAAASPVATAVVGPGGLAVSAPTATAVAGQSGGPTLVGPAQAAVNKHVTNSGKVKTKTKQDSSYDYVDDEEKFNV